MKKRNLWRYLVSGFLAGAMIVASPAADAFAAEEEFTEVAAEFSDEAPWQEELFMSSPDEENDYFEEDDQAVIEEDYLEEDDQAVIEEEDSETLQEESASELAEYDDILPDDLIVDEDVDTSDVRLTSSLSGTAIAVEINEMTSFVYSGDQTEYAFSFVPAVTGLYNFGLSMPKGRYILNMDLVHRDGSSGIDVRQNINEGDLDYETTSTFMNYKWPFALIGGKTYQFKMKSTAIDAVSGTGQFIVEQNLDHTEVSMTLGDPSQMAFGSTYRFTAEEDGMYEIRVDTLPVDESVDDSCSGYISINGKNSYAYAAFGPDQSVNTNAFFLEEGEEAFIIFELSGEPELEGTITPVVSTTRFYVKYDAGDGEFGEFDYDEGKIVFAGQKHTFFDLAGGEGYESGDHLKEYSSPMSSGIRKEGYALTGWRVGDTEQVYSDGYNSDTDNYDYENYQVTGNVTLHAVWGKIVPVMFVSNDEAFNPDDFEFFQEAGYQVSDDNKSVTVRGVASSFLTERWYQDSMDGREHYYRYNWHPENASRSKYVEYWSLDPEGNNRLSQHDDDIYYDTNGQPVSVSESGLTLYANWPDNGGGGIEVGNVIFEEGYNGGEFQGTIGNPMTLEVRATCEDAASIVYEWGNYNYDESSGYATFVPFHTGNTYTFTPQRRDVWVYARATAYDSGNDWIGSSDAFFYISSPTEARIINTTNTLKIDRNGSRQLIIQVANTVGTVFTYWSWRDKTDQDQMFNTNVGERNGTSYTVSNYSNSNIIYYGDVYDDLGYIGTAQFNFEFCTSHTGNWVVTTAPTTSSEGQEKRTCTICGHVDTRSISRLQAPVTTPVVTPAPAPEVSEEKITITQKTSSVKAKATAANKATVSWKKLKVNKKTRNVKKIEIQYSTDRSFAKGNTKSKKVGKTKTSYVIKGLKKNTTYYVRVRYTDGKGGYSNWCSVKKVKTKKK